jgi:tripartite-type tricarboxylate transporter receptor subunit TctC
MARVLALAIALTVLSAFAQTKTLRVVVPHAPGGNSDAFGRVLAAKLTERGQQAIVENRTGAGGTVGSESVARSAPDGTTILVADNGTHAVAPTLYPKLPYNVFRDFTPIMLAANFPTVILVHPSLAARNARELIALAKSQPGKLTFSSAGTGNVSHLAQELFRLAAGGLDMVHVPYKGGAPAIQALIAGDVQMTAVSVNTSLPHIKSGKARAIAVASAKRAAALPDVPTLAEQGVKGAEAGGWLALLGPAGMPADSVARLHREITAALTSPDAKERLSAVGLEVVASTPEQYTEFLKGEVEKWGDAVRRSGARAE